jgi:hypothetical protein
MGITICCCVCDIAACYASCQRRRQRRQTSSKSKAGASTEGDQTDTEDYGVDLSFDEEDDDDLDYTECGFASQDALPPGVDLNLYHRTSRSNNIHSNGDNVPMVVVPNSRSRRGILRTSKKPWRTASTSPPSVSSSVDATVGRGRRPDKGSSIATEDATVTSVASSSSSSASSSPFIVFSSAHSDDSGSVRADDDEGVVVMAAVDNEDAETNAPTQKRRGGGSGMVAPPPTSHCSERVQREAWDEFERQSSSCPLRQNNAQYINGDDYDDEAVLVHEYRLPLSVQWKRQMSALNLTPGIVQSTGLGDDDHEMDGNDCGSNDGAKITVTERELVEI